MPEPGRRITISASQMDAMGCRLHWFWSYPRGYRPKKRNVNLLMGDGIHQALEVYYDPKRRWDPVEHFIKWADAEIEKLDISWDDEVKKVEDIKTLGVEMLKNYLKFWQGREDFEVLATEHQLERRLVHPQTGEVSPYFLVARLDGLVRDLTTGKLFSLEHKTYQRSNADHLESHDHQITCQVALGQNLAESLGLHEEVVGVIYNGLRKAWDTPRTKTPLFERRKIFRTQTEVDVLLHRAFWMAHEFNKPDVPIYPQPNPMRCGGCDFKDPCKQYQTGGDYKFILDELYVSRAQQQATKKKAKADGKQDGSSKRPQRATRPKRAKVQAGAS